MALTCTTHPAGLGDAVYRARSFVGNEPFVIMLGDDLMKDKVPLTKQLDKTHAPTLAVMKMPHKEVFKYGVIAPEGKIADDLYNVKRVLSKSQQLISHQVIWLLLDVIC